MKTKLLLISLILLVSGCSTMKNNTYAKVGIGYKFEETAMYNKGVLIDDPYSARFEIGTSVNNFSFGLSHDSQWLSGAPFNDKEEYYKSEVFIDYKVYIFR